MSKGSFQGSETVILGIFGVKNLKFTLCEISDHFQPFSQNFGKTTLHLPHHRPHKTLETVRKDGDPTDLLASFLATIKIMTTPSTTVPRRTEN